MKKSVKCFTLIFGFISITAIAQHKNIKFEHGTFKELKAKAIKEKKLIFVDAYTTWCGPCKYMAKNIFTNDTVADYYNANFINAKIDMEKGEGIELAKQYEVMCFPNLLFIDGNGNLQHRKAGSMVATDFIKLGMEAQMADKNFAYYKTNFQTNKTNSEFLVKYIQVLDQTCLDTKEAVSIYFSLQKEETLTSAQNWEMIKMYSNNLESHEFIYLIGNKKKFDELYTAKQVNEKIDAVCAATLLDLIREKPFDLEKYNNTKARIIAMNLPGVKKIIFEADLRLAKKNKDWNTYIKLAVENVDVFYSNDADVLNSLAWTFYESVTDTQALTKAEGWAKLATELAPSYANLDTYASVLYKIGKKELALETANKAIELAKKESYREEDYKATTELIKKIKAMK